jgi:hypothetical protein
MRACVVEDLVVLIRKYCSCGLSAKRGDGGTDKEACMCV